MRHNYPPAGEPVDVIERYEYRFGTAGPSRIEREVHWPDRPAGQQSGGIFQIGLDYDLLGNPDEIDYPTCSSGACEDGNDGKGPAHSVTWTHNQGFMRKATSDLGPSVTYEYHTNLQLQQAVYSNGVLGEFGVDPDGIPRPRSRRFSLDSRGLFGTSRYEYDGAGNISSIGVDKYTYDGAGRLLSGTVKKAGSTRKESYTYDAADNLERVTNDQFDRPIKVSPTTNQLSTDTNFDDLSGREV